MPNRLLWTWPATANGGAVVALSLIPRTLLDRSPRSFAHTLAVTTGEVVAASGLMPKNAPVSDLADAAADTPVALATQELPDLLATLEAENCTAARC